MKLSTYLLFTFFTAFFLVYWALPTVATNRSEHVQWTRGKLYLSIFAGSIMSLLEIVLHDIYHDTVSIFHLLFFGLLVFLCAHFYRIQQSIDETDYIKQMLEAAHKDLLVSRALLEHSTNINVRTVATNIVDRRVKDVLIYEKMLADIAKPKELSITKYPVLTV